MKKYFDTSVLKDFFTYSFGALCLRGFTVLMAPITMRLLSPSDYGALALVNSFISIAVAFFGLGLRQVLFIEYFHKNETEQKQMIGEICFIYVLITIPLLLCLFLFRRLLIHYIFLDTISPFLLGISLFIIFVYFFVELFYQILQYKRKALLLTVIQVCIASLSAFFTIFFVWYIHTGFAGMLWAQSIGMICASSIGLYTFNKQKFFEYIQIKNTIQKISSYLTYGIPFIPGMIFGWLLASGDRWVLAHYSTMHNVGIYSIADTFGQLFQLLVLTPWTGSYFPYILNQYKNNKAHILFVEKKNQRTMIITLVGLATLITLGLFIVQPLLKHVLPPNYHEAIHYIWLILMGYVFLLGSYFSSSFIQYHKKTYFLALSLCLPALLNILFNILLVPQFGILGCTFATLVSYALYFALSLGYNFYLQRSYLPK